MTGPFSETLILSYRYFYYEPKRFEQPFILSERHPPAYRVEVNKLLLLSSPSQASLAASYYPFHKIFYCMLLLSPSSGTVTKK